MKILAIGAHPDDIEIFMFGILFLLKERGDEIFTIIATDGALGGDENRSLLKEKRKHEAVAGLADLSIPTFLNLPDGDLGSDPKHKKIIRDSIYNIMPDLIITHAENDYHADHRSLSLLTMSSISHYIPVIYCDTLFGLNFQPNYYIDITEIFEKKTNAILKHVSQKPKRFVEAASLMNSYRSAQCNSPLGNYAEGYYFNPIFPFSDIRNILPPSPKLRPFHIKNQFGFL